LGSYVKGKTDKKMFSQRRYLSWLMLAGLALLMLAACRNNEEPRRAQVFRPAQAATDLAATSIALTNAPPTAGPSPTPTVTSTPYHTATPFPGAEPTLVVAQVGNREITLAEYQARVRYERWLPLEEFGPQRFWDLTKPENAQLLALFYTLSDPESMGVQSMNAILTDQIILREAARRDLELEQTIFDGRMAARLDLTLGPGGARPSNWDEVYQQFLQDLYLYTGMSEQQFVEVVTALAYYEQFKQIIGQEAPLPETTVTSVEVQDIFLDSREDALQVKDRLAQGELMVDIARSFGKVAESGQTQRSIERDTEGLPEDIIEAIFFATPGAVIGPYATNAGWYIANILDRSVDIASPGDLEATRNEYFRQWVIERLDDPEYTVDYENWKDYIPLDPLPQDVSPYMRTEFFTLPPSPFEGDEPTPTPLPIGELPR
jgi:parvulin-like peptidyl-prolyl isomerase